MITHFAIVFDCTGKICLHQFLHITAASADDLDPLGFEDILCALAHIASEHHCHSHLLQYGSYTALAAAAFGRSKPADIPDFSVNDIENRIISAMTEMVINASIPCWYCYLHISKFKNPHQS